MRGAVIFDLDGCLVDSEPHSLEALAAEMRALGIHDATAEEVGARFLGVSLPVIRAYVETRAGAPVPPDFDARVERRLFAAYRNNLRLIDGVPELLARLQAAGIPMAIASGGSIPRLAETLRIAGLDAIFASRAFSADLVAHGKPAPDLFLHAAAALGVDPADCVVLEDSPHGIEGACRAGARAVGFVGGSHLAGRRQAHADLLRAKGALAVQADMNGMFDLLCDPDPFANHEASR